jgi:hypothetical protein
MAKSFNEITGKDLEYLNSMKAEQTARLCEIQYVLGTTKLVQELMCYMSTDELKEFCDHVEQHYDLRAIEEEQVAAYNDIPW